MRGVIGTHVSQPVADDDVLITSLCSAASLSSSPRIFRLGFMYIYIHQLLQCFQNKGGESDRTTGYRLDIIRALWIRDENIFD
jgi:hypothetical protein